MKEYTTEQLRNVVLVGHGTTGKTSLAESLNFNVPNEIKIITALKKNPKRTTIQPGASPTAARCIKISVAETPDESIGDG